MMFNLLRRSKRKSNNKAASTTEDDSETFARKTLNDEEFDEPTRGHYRQLKEDNFEGRSNKNEKYLNLENENVKKSFFRVNRGKKSKKDLLETTEAPDGQKVTKEKVLETNQDLRNNANTNSNLKELSAKSKKVLLKNESFLDGKASSSTSKQINRRAFLAEFEDLDDLDDHHDEAADDVEEKKAFSNVENTNQNKTKQNENEIEKNLYVEAFERLATDLRQPRNENNYVNSNSFQSSETDSQLKDVTSNSAKIFLPFSNSAIETNTLDVTNVVASTTTTKTTTAEKIRTSSLLPTTTSLLSLTSSKSDDKTKTKFSNENEVVFLKENSSDLVANNDRTNAESLNENKRFDLNLWQGLPTTATIPATTQQFVEIETTIEKCNENSQLFDLNKEFNREQITLQNDLVKSYPCKCNRSGIDDCHCSGKLETLISNDTIKVKDDDNSNQVFKQCCTTNSIRKTSQNPITTITETKATTTVPTTTKEVKLRNNIDSVDRKSNESKRQSRLSLNLSGFSLTSAKSKTPPDSNPNANLKKKRNFFSKRSSQSLEKSEDLVHFNPDSEPISDSKDPNQQPADNPDLGSRNFRKLWAFKSQRASSLESQLPSEVVGNKDEREPSVDILDVKKTSLQKSKDFLSEIFMARGRNNNRSRNQQQQPCKNVASVAHKQLQPENHNFHNEPTPTKNLISASSTTNSANTNTNTNLNTNSLANHSKRSSITSNSQNSQDNQNNCNKTTTNQSQIWQKKTSGKIFNKANIDSKNIDPLEVHLEENVKNDPSTTATTYQMTMSNNSNNKNFSSVNSNNNSHSRSNNNHNNKNNVSTGIANTQKNNANFSFTRHLKDKTEMKNDSQSQSAHQKQDLHNQPRNRQQQSTETQQQQKPTQQQNQRQKLLQQNQQRRSNSAEPTRVSSKHPNLQQQSHQKTQHRSQRSNSADQERALHQQQFKHNETKELLSQSIGVNKELRHQHQQRHRHNDLDRLKENEEIVERENVNHARNIEERSTSVPDKFISERIQSPEDGSKTTNAELLNKLQPSETKQNQETEEENQEDANEKHKLKECDGDSLLLSQISKNKQLERDEGEEEIEVRVKEEEKKNISNKIMGQTNGKPESSQNPSSTRQNIQQNSCDSEINRTTKSPSQSPTQSPFTTRSAPSSINQNCRQKSPVVVPTITVQDCSDDMEEVEHFYDFDTADNKTNGLHMNSLPDKVTIEDAMDFDEADDVFLDGCSSSSANPLNSYHNKWSSAHGHGMRFNHMKLENVPEEADAEEAAEKGTTNTYFKNKNATVNGLNDNELPSGEGDAQKQQADIDGNDDEDDEEEDEDEDEDSGHNNLDNEIYKSNFSPERSPLKSTNTSDSNLSSSCPDSGIGDSHCGSRTPLHSDSEPRHSPKRQTHQNSHHMPFVRDGNSTDCDETLLQFDDADYVSAFQTSIPEERLVCIESISLPDVVVESTNSSISSNTSLNQTGSVSSSHQQSSKFSKQNYNDDDDDGEHIININPGASGNNMGNVHFIPIHVESSTNNRKESSSSHCSSSFSTNNCQKRRSIDDSFIGNSSNLKSSSSFLNQHPNHLHHHQHMPTIEIIEDENGKTIEFAGYDIEAEKLKRELKEQKSKFNIQLEDAHKNVQVLQSKVEDMHTKIEKLEQELSTKTWNVERLQSELAAAHKDDEYVRKKLKLLEDEKTVLRHKVSENEDEYKRRYEELEMQYNELNERFQETQKLANHLQVQVATAQTEAEESRNELEKIRAELEEQIRILRNALENSEAERKICEDRWQKEFELLRTHNIEREETIMTDCEWQLRQTQKQCKDRLDKSDRARQEALEKAKLLENELEDKKREISDLKIYQAQVTSLRGVVQEQEVSIQTLLEQIKNLKSDLEIANDNLKDQIDAVRKIKIQCDNAIYDKERQMIYRIDEVRHEAAAFWEDKLYTEMTRLKNELESVYVDERREALDKLQAEHIEELRALTTRYTANEDELQLELAELQEKLERKNEEFLELRDKSDNALLQTRMHLDRADREFQNAMCREEERREALEVSLKKEFEQEKQDMEERFRERLDQVKEEFARELQITKQEMTEHHKKELERQKALLRAEKEEALQELAERHRKKLAAAEDRIKDIELRHQRDLKDLKAAYDAEKASLDKRDISNANEIEQLHRKCRCLTNLFEEMRMRYERRDPRQEDLREIAELRTRCESQERDLYVLTDRLREMQIEMSELQRQPQQKEPSINDGKKAKRIKKPPPKTIPTSCDVIYEENEERDSPPPIPLTPRDDDEEEDDDDESPNEENENLSKTKSNLMNVDDSRLITAL